MAFKSITFALHQLVEVEELVIGLKNKKNS
jgi:hypothetical protein